MEMAPLLDAVANWMVALRCHNLGCKRCRRPGAFFKLLL
jgi:hypothetical protein